MVEDSRGAQLGAHNLEQRVVFVARAGDQRIGVTSTVWIDRREGTDRRLDGPILGNRAGRQREIRRRLVDGHECGRHRCPVFGGQRQVVVSVLCPAERLRQVAHTDGVGSLVIGVVGQLEDHEKQARRGLRHRAVEVVVKERQRLDPRRQTQARDREDLCVAAVQPARAVVEVDGHAVDERVGLRRGQRIGLGLFEEELHRHNLEVGVARPATMGKLEVQH